jgi:trans-aconitate methyltransferase
MTIQRVQELENWYATEDPWGYETNPDDLKRREYLISELPQKDYCNVLDIGCGEGFITGVLPGVNIVGIDPSQAALAYARKKHPDISFIRGGIFEVPELFGTKGFDLMVITGVLYPQYIGHSETFIYSLIDEHLAVDGVLVSVHIADWYSARFPYPMISSVLYPYREYIHSLEIYAK